MWFNIALVLILSTETRLKYTTHLTCVHVYVILSVYEVTIHSVLKQTWCLKDGRVFSLPFVFLVVSLAF